MFTFLDPVSFPLKSYTCLKLGMFYSCLFLYFYYIYMYIYIALKNIMCFKISVTPTFETIRKMEQWYLRNLEWKSTHNPMTLIQIFHIVALPICVLSFTELQSECAYRFVIFLPHCSIKLYTLFHVFIFISIILGGCGT